jgi:polysaccharide biosynthesis/export protein
VIKIDLMLITVALASAASLAGAQSAAPEKAPAANAASVAEPGYRLGPEDVIEVFVWKEPELTASATVRPDGRISMPLVGEIVAAGKTPGELQTEIARGLVDFVTEPVVTVIVKEVRSPQVSVLGEVRKPGRYRIAQSSTVLDAIAMGGGFTDYAHRGRVVVLRQGKGGVQRIEVDVDRLVRRGEVPLALRPGDTVYVD